MSAIHWARTVRCDWPGCQSEGEVTLGNKWPDRSVPAGWTDLGRLIMTKLPNGGDIREVCSIHSASTLAQLAAIAADEHATA